MGADETGQDRLRRTASHALEIARLGVWTWRVHDGRVDADARTRDICGLDPKAALTLDSIFPRIHADDRARIEQALLDALSPGGDGRYEEELRFVHADGSEHWVAARGSAVFAGDGADRRGVEIVGTVLDISPRVRTERALRRSEAMFHELADTAPAMLWVTDAEGGCTFLSRGWYEYTGQVEAEALGFGWLDAVHPDDRGHAGAEFAAATRERRAFSLDYRLRTADGAYRWCIDAGRPRGVEGGAFAGFVGSVIDIDERKRASEALGRSEARYRSLFESMDEGFCVLEMIFDADRRPVDYRFLEINPSFERQSGLRDARGRTARELVPGLEDRWVRLYGQVATTGVPMRFVEGSEAMGRWFEVYAYRIDDPGDHRVALLFDDISERKRAEEALREADRRKDRFLAMLAHELRNPLAPVRTALQVLANSDEPETVARMRAIIGRQVDQMTRLVDDLIEVSRITRGKVELRKESVDLGRIVRDAIEASRPVVEGGGHDLDVSLPTTALQLFADPARIAQVVANLLNNAAKYSPPGTRIEVRAWRERAEAVLSVRDQGQGIPADQLQEIFELFTQLDAAPGHGQAGLGIGLSLARSLVSMHDGVIEARSEGLGRGSEFIVRLPLSEPRAMAAPAPSTPAGQLIGLKVLVVDDNLDVTESFGDWLALYRADVRTVSSGEAALARMQEDPAHVVLLDLGMPGMDGYEVARRIRQEPVHAQAELVAMTGWGAPADRERSRSAGIDHHMTKPPDLAALHALLASIHARLRAPVDGSSG